eukprot:287183_1
MAIGYDAWELYRKQCETKENHKYMYFQHPHKSIYNVVDVANPYNIRIHAVDNISSLPLSTVITKLVQGIMKQVLECINMWNTLAGIPLVKYYADICWIIPIPIVWFYSVETVQFMDYCLRDAGMTTFHLCGDTIAAASYCTNHECGVSTNKVVLDCGGHSIDALSVTMDSNTVSDIYGYESLCCGGMDIGKQFGLLLEELLPSQIITQAKHMEPHHWNDQLMEFDRALSCVPFEMRNDDTWNVPFCFKISSYLTRMRRRRRTGDEYVQLRNKINSYLVNEEDIVKLKRSNLQITTKGWLYLHEEVLNKIEVFCQNIFGECSDIISIKALIKQHHHDYTVMWLFYYCTIPENSFKTWCG